MIDLKNFEARLRSVHKVDRRRRASYSPELLQMAERLHLQDKLPLKVIAEELAKDPAFQNCKWRTIHSRLCRHIRQITTAPAQDGQRKRRKVTSD